MASNIMKILNKKLTGKELGNLVLKQVVYQLVNKTDKEIFKRAEIELASSNLSQPNDIKAFNDRIAIASFLDDITNRGNYADLLIKQKDAVIHIVLEKMLLALSFLEEKQPLRFSYKGYENYKKQKTEEFITSGEGDIKTTLFDIILEEIPLLYDTNDEARKLIDTYEGKQLNAKEKAFYDKSDKEKHIDESKIEEFRKLVFEKNDYKQALQYVVDRDTEQDLFTTARKNKPYDKADLIYDLHIYWNNSDKSDDTFKNILSEYTDILTYTLKALNKNRFAGKLSKIELKDTRNHFYTLRELQKKYGYCFIEEALENQPVLITTYETEDTIYDKIKLEVDTLKGFLTKDTFLTPLNALEETIVYIKNLNIIYDLLAEYTGQEDIQQLKFDLEGHKERLQEIYKSLALCFFRLQIADISKEEIDFLRTVFKNFGNIVSDDEEKTDKKINRAKAILNSSNSFKDSQSEFYYTVLGKINIEA